MHSSTFVFVLVALFTVLSLAHPIHHFPHRNVKVQVRANERSCKPPVVNSSGTPLPTSTPVPVPSDVPSDVPTSILRPSLIAKASSPVPTSTKKDDDEDDEPTPTSTGEGGGDGEPTPTSTGEGDEGDEPTQTPSSGGGSSLTDELFPYGFGENSWTTSEGIDGALPLSDATLKPTRVMNALSRDIVRAPDGKLGMRAHYPQGSYTFSHRPLGGFSFYAKGPSDVDLSTALEATFGYSVFFEEDFDYQLGGKLLGFYGGESDEVAVGCSGGRRDTRCWSTRLMWRAEGEGELYTYLPSPQNPGFEANSKLCNVAPSSECNPTYGASVGRGAFDFKSGQWNTVSQRVRLNDVGQSNGEMELFFNGKSVINVRGLRFRNNAQGRFRGLQAQTFFGGSRPEFASPKSQNTYFSDFSVAIIKTL